MFVITNNNTIVMIKLQSTMFMPTERGKRPHVDLSNLHVDLSNLETNENILALLSVASQLASV